MNYKKVFQVLEIVENDTEKAKKICELFDTPVSTVGTLPTTTTTGQPPRTPVPTPLPNYPTPPIY